MRLIAAEVAKLWRTTPLAWFLLGCLAVNGMILISGPDPEYPRFVAASTAGVPGQDELSLRLAADRAEQRNVFADFDPLALAESYQRALGYDGVAARMIAAKYAGAVPIVAERAAAQRAFDLYYASDTDYLHGFVFGTLLGAVTIQTFIFAAIAGSQVRAIEANGGPGPVVFSSRTGRRVLLAKLVAVVASTVAAYAVLALAAISSAEARYHLSGVWDSSVSSSFHQVLDLIVGPRPFFTWLDLSVGNYLLASVAIAITLAITVAIVAFGVGAVVANNYFGFGIILVGGGVLLAGPTLGGLHPAALLFGMNPVWLWLKQPGWFTDGGLDTLVPHFETVGAFASLALAAIAALLTYRHYLRTEL